MRIIAHLVRDDGSQEFRTVALRLLLLFLDRRMNPKLKKIRLIGLRMEKLVKPDAGA